MLALSCKQSDETLIKKMIETFKTESLNKKEIDWANFEVEVFKSLKISKDSAIITALTLNHNPHTFFFSGKKILKGNYVKERKDSCILNRQEFRSAKDFGYIKVKSFSQNPHSTNHYTSEAAAYVLELLDSIKKYDQPGLKGWIIDLRYNGGGNMWPMLVALRPFLEDGELGSFRSANLIQAWTLEDNDVYLDGKTQSDGTSGASMTYKIKNGSKKIAVLINRRTASSGEAVAIALRTVKAAKFFGTTTNGFATANRPIRLGNKETLILTTSEMYDYKGVHFPQGIKPDFFICKHAELVQAISKWIYQ